MSGATLFAGSPPRLFAAPASAPFLDLLADSLVQTLAREGDAFALSDALILLPNRRAARGLIDAFAKRLGGAALLPAIRPLGDLDEDPQVWGADPIGLDVAPAIEPTRQRMELAALIRARDKAQGGVEDPARALALADELRALLEGAAAAEHVHWERLPTLVRSVEFARHWEASAEFLQIVARYWPQRLALDGLLDPGARRAALLRALARDWRANPPARPVIIAGSTGSIAATRELMAVVAGLPQGAVIFPGLDTDLDDEAWSFVAEQHPQFALKETLAALGVARGTIPLLAAEMTDGRARRVLMREALAPAEKTADWLKRIDEAVGAGFVAAGATGLSILEAATEDEEAAAIALMLREVLETPNQTAALVTPDAGLARRVESKLARWGLEAAVSHGRPLRETEAGRLIELLCELALDLSEPVALAGLLKHPRVLIAEDAAALAALERTALRGARRFESLAELETLHSLQELPQARAIVERVREALAPIAALMGASEISLARFAEALTDTAERAAPDIWQDRDGEAAANLLREAIAHGGELGAVAAHAAPRVLLRLMQGLEVPPSPAGDARVAIWGPLEARLQRRDLMILGGLNEGVWPAPPPEEAFLSRSMRVALGLPSPDQRIGLAAHDFAQLASAPNVVLTRALRRDGAPTLASRWLWRLQTLAKGAHASLQRADRYVVWAHALDRPVELRPTLPPRPAPPAHQRLKRLSVTRVETLIRDPYVVYARMLLGLEALKPIGEPAGPAERGTAVHAAIEAFGDGRDAADLTRLLDEHLRQHGMSAERRAAERERLAASVHALIAWFDQRRARKAAIHREIRGELPIGDVLLTGIADRIEIAKGHAVILDFKTGAPPTDAQVESGLSPQLLLEAAMLAEGAFPNLRAEATELIYWRFGNADPAPRAVDLVDGPHAAGMKALAALKALLTRYADPQQPFLSKPRVLKVRLYDDYDHLARRKEWADETGDDV